MPSGLDAGWDSLTVTTRTSGPWKVSVLRRCALVLCLLFAPVAMGQTLLVSAASSLTEAFGDIAAAFEAHHGTRVRLNLAGSSTLAAQIVQGAPVDVFASADVTQMAITEAEGATDGPAVVFARNRMVVIATPDGPVHTLEDLAAPGVLLVLAAPDVPAGAYGRRVLDALDEELGEGFAQRALANLASEEPNVRQAAAKVALGEADAALVYATDAAVLTGVRTIPLPDAAQIVAEYPVAVLRGASDPDLARAFVAFLLGPDAQGVLAERGFEPPPSP